MTFWELAFWELTFWEVDVLGVDVLGVDVLGVDILGVDILGVDILRLTRCKYDYSITTNHKALDSLLTTVTVKTDLQSTIVEKYLQFHFPLHHDCAIVRS